MSARLITKCPQCERITGNCLDSPAGSGARAARIQREIRPDLSCRGGYKRGDESLVNPPVPLLPGDTLVYGVCDFAGCIICLKTWSPACHVEIYAGTHVNAETGEETPKSFASRNGIGVDIYDLRLDQLIAVRRPANPIDIEKGALWFYEHARGQKYDWLGLLCFTLAVKRGSKDRMFCSEFWKRFYPRCGLDVMAPDWDADKTAPAQCLQTPALKTIWSKGQKQTASAIPDWKYQPSKPWPRRRSSFEEALAFLNK